MLLANLINHYLVRYQRWRLANIQQSLPVQHLICHGPFKGLRYSGKTDPQLLPKVLGAYQNGLHDTIRRLAEDNFERVICVGSDNGYYAMGLSRLFARVLVLTESAEESLRCQLLARDNGLAPRIELIETIKPAHLKGRVLLFCVRPELVQGLELPEEVTVFLRKEDERTPGFLHGKSIHVNEISPFSLRSAPRWYRALSALDQAICTGQKESVEWILQLGRSCLEPFKDETHKLQPVPIEREILTGLRRSA